jgi:hypothetical protein
MSGWFFDSISDHMKFPFIKPYWEDKPMTGKRSSDRVSIAADQRYHPIERSILETRIGQ